MKMIVPAYFYPSPGSPWERLIEEGPAGIKYVVANINSGNVAGQMADANYVTVLDRARDAGLPIAYYVDTNYQAVPIATVENNIDGYILQYGRPDAWFFDRTAGTSGTADAIINYYKTIKSYVGTDPVIHNFGTPPIERYVSEHVADIAVVAENSDTAYRAMSFPAWTLTYPKSRFAHLAYSSPDYTVDMTFVANKNVGYVFFTDVAGYFNLPSYYDNLKKALAGVSPNYWLVKPDGIYKVVNGAPLLAQGWAVLAGNHRFDVHALGSVLVVLRDGVELATVTDPFNADATRQGMWRTA